MEIKTIGDVFELHCGHLKFDANLVRRVNRYRTLFMTKNDAHIAFFGGNTLGVHKVLFLPSDREMWFQEIMQADQQELAFDFSKAEGYNPKFKVESDPLNSAFAWFAHKAYNSEYLSDSQKQQMMVDVFFMLNTKFLTSRLVRHFEHPADPEVAAAAFEQYSNKFHIRKYGSWGRLLEERAKDTISRSSIHIGTIEKFVPNKKVRYILSDSQTRIREMIKGIVDIQYRLAREGVRIKETSATFEHEGEMVIRDKTDGPGKYANYINSIISDEGSFVKSELVGVIQDLVPNMPPAMFAKSLSWLCKTPKINNVGLRDDIVVEIMVHAINYLYSRRNEVRKTTDLSYILGRLKGTYTSSRNVDPTLINLRAQLEDVVRQATGQRHDGNVSATRTGILLYVVARAMTMKHFSGMAGRSATR